MTPLHIITPVKDSIDTTLDTIRSVMSSELRMPHRYTVYNDFSTAAHTATLHRAAEEMGFDVVDLSDLTDHPSPNYLLTLRTAQREAIEAGATLCIVESDVTVKPKTLQALAESAEWLPQCGIAAAVTVDTQGTVNYPYLHARKLPQGILPTDKHCSFCCSLLTPNLLQSYDFNRLDDTKSWFDVTISHQSLHLGLRNYLFTALPVTHRPHQSRPWKQLKYTNPLLYYWKKYTKGLDKI